MVIEIGRPLPFKDQEFDLIVSDYTFEHVSNSDEVASELDRILKPGGWICARTPNKWGYVSLLTRMIKSKSHARVLKKAQPDRKEIDVFPTSFKMNTRRSLRRYFDPQRFEHFTYYYESEPRYFFNSKVIFWMMSTFNRFLPSMFRSNLFIFIRKK